MVLVYVPPFDVVILYELVEPLSISSASSTVMPCSSAQPSSTCTESFQSSDSLHVPELTVALVIVLDMHSACDCVTDLVSVIDTCWPNP